jgi:hypothetical protein
MVRMIIAICKERALPGAIISTVAKHNRKIYPQAVAEVEQVVPSEASPYALINRIERLALYPLGSASTGAVIDLQSSNQ